MPMINPTQLVVDDGSGNPVAANSSAAPPVLTKDYSLPASDWSFAGPVAGLTTGSDTAAKAAGATGVRNYVTGLQVQNNSATASEFQIKDGAATVLWRCMCPANMPLTTVWFPNPLRGTAATALNVQAVTAASVIICDLQGYSSTV